ARNRRVHLSVSRDLGRIPLHEQKTVLTRIAEETQDPEATGETCRREQNRGDEDPLSPTNPALGGGEQQWSEKPADHRHFREGTDRAVDELEIEQRRTGNCLEDRNRSRGRGNTCRRELDERDVAGCEVSEIHQPRIV